MKLLTPLVGLTARMYLAAFFLAHAIQYKLGPGPEWLAAFFPAHFSEHIGWQDRTLAVLLLIIALWLILGIRSRIVGLLGFVLCSAGMVLRHEVPLELVSPLAWTPDRLAALAAVLMLALVGGGKWRLHPGGWRIAA